MERSPADRPVGTTGADRPVGTTGAREQRFDREAEAEHGGTFTVRRDLIRWGPIIAGIAVTITTLTVLSALGLAIGLSALEPGEGGLPDADVASWLWTVGISVVAFMLGGATAAGAAAVGGRDAGLLNGLMVGVVSIALIVAFVGTGVGSILGAATSNLGTVADVGEQLSIGAEGSDIAFDAAKDQAWGTFLSLVIAIGAAGAGGILAARSKVPNRPPRR